VIVETPVHGFVENSWLGRGLGIGDEVELSVAMPDPRCVMPNLGQEDLPRDPQILRTLVHHNRIDVAGSGLYPCAGVYAVVGSAGTVRRGDRVRMT
jgi:MOSC domain-containing protein